VISKYMKYLLVFIILFSFSFSIFSQESVESESSSTDPDPSTPPEEDLPAPQSGEQSDFEVFEPSETVSEDLSVPFPVDI